MSKTHLSNILTALLFIALSIFNGCAEHKETVQARAEAVPDITAAYLLEHRIISYEPRYLEKVITTLPYEIKTFDESYVIYLVARLPDKNSTAIWKVKEPHYYLWLERRSNNWRDFTTVYATGLNALTINSHYSAIRQGKYYKEYTINLSLEQLSAVQDSGLELVLINQHGIRSTVTVPGDYVKAYLEMLPPSTQ